MERIPVLLNNPSSNVKLIIVDSDENDPPKKRTKASDAAVHLVVREIGIKFSLPSLCNFIVNNQGVLFEDYLGTKPAKPQQLTQKRRKLFFYSAS